MSWFTDALDSVPVVGTAMDALGYQTDKEKQSDAQYQAMLDLYRQIYGSYTDPNNDPGYQKALNQLQQWMTGKALPEDKAAELEALNQASGMARGREGAIEQEALARGGGYSSSGQLAGMQEQASQSSANRLQSADMQTAANVSRRAQAANAAFRDTIQRNADAQNRYRVAAGGLLGGGYDKMGDVYGSEAESQKMARDKLQKDAVDGIALLMGKPPPSAANASTAPGGVYQGRPASYSQSEAGYNGVADYTGSRSTDPHASAEAYADTQPAYSGDDYIDTNGAITASQAAKDQRQRSQFSNLWSSEGRY